MQGKWSWLISISKDYQMLTFLKDLLFSFLYSFQICITNDTKVLRNHKEYIYH